MDSKALLVCRLFLRPGVWPLSSPFPWSCFGVLPWAWLWHRTALAFAASSPSSAVPPLPVEKLSLWQPALEVAVRCCSGEVSLCQSCPRELRSACSVQRCPKAQDTLEDAWAPWPGARTYTHDQAELSLRCNGAITHSIELKSREGRSVHCKRVENITNIVTQEWNT